MEVVDFRKQSVFITSPERSAHMKKIKGRDTREEISLRKELWKKGIRYRKNYKKLPGCPDVVITKNKIAIFIDGEFWHGYDWIRKRDRIKNNRGYWIPKIERNMERDKEVNESLTKNGYRVLRFWSNLISKDLEGCIQKVLRNLD